ncbi:cathepsin S-like [Ambystoma mexicanum]|uniref:cathepsin S-like n=1 Tax=Ambystoma mexicanum TaxID=8296 RepID=UPI0037E7AEB5
MHKVKHLALLASLLAGALAAEFLDSEWQAWKTKFDKKYKTAGEEVLRRERWESTWKMVMQHNKLADQGKKSYWMGINHFSDRTLSELRAMSCLRVPTFREKSASKFQSASSKVLPAYVDWRDEKCVTAVKNQGDYCGSCWAFAAVGALESRYCIKTGELMEMSEQELVDCDSEDGGCCGGFPYSAYKFISEKGIMASSHYKYKGRNAGCRFKQRKAVPLNITKYYELNGEDNMAAAVASDGPITVGFAVSSTFFSYREGIYDDECAAHPNHAIIIVGYGTEDHEDYWIIKNSWGPQWGNEGYAKVRRNANVCAISDMGAAMDLQ